MILYIAGPMTGYRRFNYDAFHLAAAQLSAAGFAVLNPADPDEAEPGRDHPREWYLRRALRKLLEADGVALLPGWEWSQGARLEVEIARNLNMPVDTVDRYLTRWHVKEKQL